MPLRPASRRALRHLLVPSLYLVLSLLMTWPLARQFGSAIPGDSFDGWQNVWNLWWMRESWLVRHTSPYFAPILDYPTGADLRFQTMAPFNGLAFLPIQLAFGLLPAYNAAVLFSFVAGGYGAYLLALYALGAGGRPLNDEFRVQSSEFRIQSSAFIAGVIYAFSPYHFAHLLGHLQLITLQWIPFYVLYILRSLDRTLPSRALTDRIFGDNSARDGRTPAGITEDAIWIDTSTGAMPHSPRSTFRELHLTRQALRSSLSDILKPALFLILVGLSDWYYVLYCLIFTALLLAVRLIQRRLTWRGVGLVAGVGLVFAIALAPLLLPMVRAAGQWSGSTIVRGVDESAAFSADLLAFVTPQTFHPLWGAWAAGRSAAFPATRSEFTVFAGYTVLALAGLGLLAAWRGKAKAEGKKQETGKSSSASTSTSASFWLLAAGVFALLALGPVLHVNGRSDLLPGGAKVPLPYALLYQLVPFVKLSRSVSRFDVMVMLCLGVAAAFGVAALGNWVTGRLGNRKTARLVGWATPVAVAGLVLFEFAPMPYPLSPPDTPAWYQTLAMDPSPGAVLNLPATYERPWYLLYQITHGKPIATGYVTRDDPRILRERAPVLSHFRFLGPDIHTKHFDLGSQGMQVLHDLLGVGWVVIDRYKMGPSGPERELTQAYAQQIFSGQAPIYQDDRLTVYQVTEPAVRGPFVVLSPGWQPRSSDGIGRVWREVLADQPAGFEVVNPDHREVMVQVTARAQDGGLLRLLAADGGELAAWPMEPASTSVRAGPLAPAQTVSPLQLEYIGPPGSKADIEELETTVAQ